MTSDDDSELLFDLLEDLRQEVSDLRERVSEALTKMGALRRQYYSVNEVARLVGRSAYTVRRWLREGRLQGIKVIGDAPIQRDSRRAPYLIPRDEVVRLLQRGVIRERRSDRDRPGVHRDNKGR